MKKALLISCFEWYEQRLEPLKELLENNYEITILLSDFDHISKRKIATRRSDCTYIHVPPYDKNISLKRIFSHLEFGWKVKKQINRIRPDFIYLVLPPNNTAFYCLRYKKRRSDTTYIIDVIDLWPESMPINKRYLLPLKKIWENLRDSSLMRADYVFTECELYKKHLEKMQRIRNIKVNYLFKAQSDTAKAKIKDIISETRYDWKKNKHISLGYLGSINYIIDIEKIANIIQKLLENGYGVTVDIIGDGTNRHELEEKIVKLGAKVNYFGKIFDETKKIEILGRCDFGLNIMKESVTVGLTTKSIDYLSYGLPMVNNIKGDTWALVQKEKLGVNFTGNLDKFMIDILEYKEDRRHIVNCYVELFTKQAYQNNLNKYLKL